MANASESTSKQPLPEIAPAIRRLCFGGTFNPIHHGHLLCARAAAEARGFHRITLIPSAEPPHKSSITQTHSVAPVQDRLAMCRLAVLNDPLFEVNDIELQRHGPSFTVDTARELRRQGWKNVPWLIGADTVATLPSWHDPLNLLADVEFIVMERPGSPIDWSLTPQPFQVLRSQTVVLPLIEISASEIRSRVQDGRSLRYLTPDAVINYIADGGLYR